MPTFEENVKFAQDQEVFYNKLYRELGYDIVDRKDTKYYDVKLRKGKFIFTVEEKALRDLNDFLWIETTQDTTTNKTGWIYYTKADFLVYGMFGDQVLVYRIPLKDFKLWFERNIDQFVEKPSTKGWGHTLNRIVPIKDIPSSLIKLIHK